MDHVRKLRFSSIVHLTSMKNCFNFLTLERFCNVGEVHIFKHRLYISASEQARLLKLDKYILQGAINTIYKHCLA